MQDRIKKVRKKFGLTQSEFGARIGVRGNTVTGYETGLRAPSGAVLHAIAMEFGVDEDWLKNGGADEVQLKPPAEHDIVEAIAREYRQGAVFRAVMDAYLSLTPQDRAVMDNFVRRLAQGVSAQQLIDDPESMLSALDNPEAQPDGGERA